jgi:cytochrome b6-f complex iron-sulfur subunit
MLKRRSFLTYFSIAWFASCFPVVLAACAPSAADKTSAKPVSTKTADGFTIVGTVAELDKAGQLQTQEVAVSRDPVNPQKLLAVNLKCTHQGCIIKWETGEKKYECPCHDSNFSADGKVLKGPATKPLATYPVKIVGTQVLVKV